MKVLAYTILFAVLFSLFARLQVYINYLVNQEYYAKVLCENKAVKASCCHGKCAMEKELVSLDKKEQEQPAKSEGAMLKLSKVEQALCSTLLLRLDLQLTAVINTPFAGLPADGNTSAAFKPPCA